MMNDDVFNGHGVKIKLKEKDDFLKVKETLTRIGVENKRDKILYQSCNILHKRGEYAILHFKEMFEMDGRQSTIDDVDIKRRNTIVKLLSEWGLIETDTSNLEFIGMNQVKVLPYKEKDSYQLISKYNIGVEHGKKK
jgi:hypothetical protein